MTGFVTDYATAITDNHDKGWYVVPGTAADMIMGCYTPATLPVLSALARGFAVCDHWYASAPTMTMPNRAFACAATSQGQLDDKTKSFTVPSIFGQLTAHSVPWKIYGYTASPLTRSDFPDTKTAPKTRFGHFSDFRTDAAAAPCRLRVPGTQLELNRQQPAPQLQRGTGRTADPGHLPRGARRTSLGLDAADPHLRRTRRLLRPRVPTLGATAPDNSAGESVRLHPVRAQGAHRAHQPLIEAGTVHRVPDGSTPLDHTSILATIEHRWSIPPLTRRDAAAPDVAGALTRSMPRTDDPLSASPRPPRQPPRRPWPPTLAPATDTRPTPHPTLGTDREPVLPAGLHTNADYQRYIDSASRSLDT